MPLTGLIAQCNTFNDPVYSIGVAGQEPTQYLETTNNGVGINTPEYSGIGGGGIQWTPPLPLSGVSTNQGQAYNQSAGNLNFTNRNVFNAPFINNSYSPSCINNGENKFYINVYNTAYPQVILGSVQGAIYYPDPQTNNACSNGIELQNQYGQNYNPSAGPLCPPNIYSTYASKTINEKLTDYRIKILQQKNKLQAETDNNRTSQLLSVISNQTISANNLRDTLLASPYLSDTVLKAYFSRAALTPSIAYTVFEKNVPVSKWVWPYVLSMSLTSNEQSQWNTKQMQNKLCKRDSIFYDMGMNRNQLGLLNNEKVRRFYTGIEGQIQYDSLNALYNSGEVSDAAVRKIELNLSTGNFNEAQTQINSFRTASNKNQIICNMLQFSKNIMSNQEALISMRTDTTIRSYLRKVANVNYYLVQGYARALLYNVYNEMLDGVDIAPVIDSYGNRQAKEDNQSNEIKIVDKNTVSNIAIYPNPASNLLYLTNSNSEIQVNFTLTDISGRVIAKGKIDGESQIALSSLQNGIYFLNLYSGDKMLSSNKVIIAK
jgi:hypothetical protein